MWVISVETGGLNDPASIDHYGPFASHEHAEQFVKSLPYEPDEAWEGTSRYTVISVHRVLEPDGDAVAGSVISWMENDR